MTIKRKRPQHCPTEIRSPWPGITYPDEYGLQVRTSVNKVRRSRYYSYASFGGNVAAAHRAAAEWRMQVLAGKKFKLKSKGFRERTLQRRAEGVREHALVCLAQRPDGKRVQVLFYIGTDNTATKESRRRAKLRAEMWWGQYRRWYEEGGRHPMDARGETMKADVCKHWRGIGLGDDHTMCNVGVDVKKLGEFHRPGMLNRLPCTGLGGRQGETLAECALADYPTAEEVAADEKDYADHFRLVWPVLRDIKANSKPGDSGTRNCPKCDGTLHWFRHPSNGHLHAGCETPNCVHIME